MQENADLVFLTPYQEFIPIDSVTLKIRLEAKGDFKAPNFKLEKYASAVLITRDIMTVMRALSCLIEKTFGPLSLLLAGAGGLLTYVWGGTIFALTYGGVACLFCYDVYPWIRRFRRCLSTLDTALAFQQEERKDVTEFTISTSQNKEAWVLLSDAYEGLTTTCRDLTCGNFDRFP